MRDVNHLVIHCTGTQGDASVSSIEKYWSDYLGWRSKGYHFLIEADGTIHHLTPLDEIANGVRGHNKDSIHISYIGGIDEAGNPKDTRTRNQQDAMTMILWSMIGLYPDAEILGHRDFDGVAKACPSFDVAQWCAEMAIPTNR